MFTNRINLGYEMSFRSVVSTVCAENVGFRMAKRLSASIMFARDRSNLIRLIYTTTWSIHAVNAILFAERMTFLTHPKLLTAT